MGDSAAVLCGGFVDHYSGRKATRVKDSVCIIKFFFILGVAMGREIKLRATNYCSRSRFLYSAGTS